MQHYTVGFVLSLDRQRVALLQKQKPIQHRGLYNGVGGRIESGETPLANIRRECHEETGLRIAIWHLLERGLADDGGDLFTYVALCPVDQNVVTGDVGLAKWFAIAALPANIVPDVARLVTRAVRQSHYMK